MSEDDREQETDFLETEAAYVPAGSTLDPALEPRLQQYTAPWSRQGAPFDFLECAPGSGAGEREQPPRERNPLGLPARIRAGRARPLILTGSRTKGG